jgi:hypothetical protein
MVDINVVLCESLSKSFRNLVRPSSESVWASELVDRQLRFGIFKGIINAVAGQPAS